MKTTFASRLLQAENGRPHVAEINVQLDEKTIYVQDNRDAIAVGGGAAAIDTGSGISATLGGCKSADMSYCRANFPASKVLGDVKEFRWLFDTDGFFGNTSIDRLMGGVFSEVIPADSEKIVNTCDIDPTNPGQQTIMMSIGDSILNGALPQWMFEPMGPKCDCMMLEFCRCGHWVSQGNRWQGKGGYYSNDAWKLTLVQGKCGDYNDPAYAAVPFTTYTTSPNVHIEKIPDCVAGKQFYVIDIHPVCEHTFPNPENTLNSDKFIYDSIRLTCTSSISGMLGIKHDIKDVNGKEITAWDDAAATIFIARSLNEINLQNALLYYFNVVMNFRPCPNHNNGLLLTLTFDDLSGFVYTLGQATSDQTNLPKLCGAFLSRNKIGFNDDTISCMHTWRFDQAWILSWPHLTMRDNANPPHRYEAAPFPISPNIFDEQFQCPATITAAGCIPPDEDKCLLGRSQSGYWVQQEWTTTAGTRLTDLVPTAIYGTTTALDDKGRPESSTFEGISQKVDIVIGERVDEARDITGIRSFHDPMICPKAAIYLNSVGYLGSGGGSYATINFNFTWFGVPPVNPIMYMAVVDRSDCISNFLPALSANSFSAAGQYAHSRVTFGQKSVIIDIPFTIDAPRQQGSAEMLVCPYYLDSVGNRLPCDMTLAPTSVTISYSVLTLDPVPSVKYVGHEFVEHECFAGICSIGWPFGFGFTFWVFLILFIIIFFCGICLYVGYSLPRIPDLPKFKST